MATQGPTSLKSALRFASSMLQSARIERGWSQRQLAAAAGVPQSMMSQIKSGRQQPTTPTLMRILAAADLDMWVHLAPYDVHDDVLYALHAARTPQERDAGDAAHIASVDRFAGRTVVPRA